MFCSLIKNKQTYKEKQHKTTSHKRTVDLIKSKSVFWFVVNLFQLELLIIISNHHDFPWFIWIKNKQTNTPTNRHQTTKQPNNQTTKHPNKQAHTLSNKTIMKCLQPKTATFHPYPINKQCHHKLFPFNVNLTVCWITPLSVRTGERRGKQTQSYRGSIGDTSRLLWQWYGRLPITCNPGAVDFTLLKQIQLFH